MEGHRQTGALPNEAGSQGRKGGGAPGLICSHEPSSARTSPLQPDHVLPAVSHVGTLT